MGKRHTGQDSFLIKIMNTQNADWQGTITWTESNRTEPFRSALEMIRLIDSVVGQEDATPAAETERNAD